MTCLPVHVSPIAGSPAHRPILIFFVRTSREAIDRSRITASSRSPLPARSCRNTYVCGGRGRQSRKPPR